MLLDSSAGRVLLKGQQYYLQLIAKCTETMMLTGMPASLHEQARTWNQVKQLRADAAGSAVEFKCVCAALNQCNVNINCVAAVQTSTIQAWSSPHKPSSDDCKGASSNMLETHCKCAQTQFLLS